MVLIAGMMVSAFAQGKDENRRQIRKRTFDKEWTAKSARPERRFANMLTEQQKVAIKDIRLKSAGDVRPLKYKLEELKARQQTLIDRAGRRPGGSPVRILI